MVCTRVKLGDGSVAIVCGPRQKPKPCSKCGRPAGLLCDWKVPERLSGTCDAPICARCTHSPAKDKDLCPKHAEQLQQMKAKK